MKTDVRTPALASAGRIKGFDGLRALCVILVFVDHFVWWRHGLGSLGVKIFFTLSGFLIIGILHEQRKKIEAKRKPALQEFYIFWINRALRIFPIYFLTLAGILAYTFYRELPHTYQGLQYYFAFAGNVYIQHVSHSWGMFTHLWSISVEQHFYMLASPLLLFLPSKWWLRYRIYVQGSN